MVQNVKFSEIDNFISRFGFSRPKISQKMNFKNFGFADGPNTGMLQNAGSLCLFTSPAGAPSVMLEIIGNHNEPVGVLIYQELAGIRINRNRFL